MVGQQRVSRRVRFVKTVAGELFHQVENLVGALFSDAIFGRPCAEDGAVLGHFFGFFLAHGAAQHIGAAQRVATQNLRGLHHLLLIDHDAVSLAQHAFEHGVGVMHRGRVFFARNKVGDVVHRPWAIQGVEGNQIFKTVGLGLL